MADKFWTHLKLKNGDEVHFVPPAPDGEQRGGVTETELSQLRDDLADKLTEPVGLAVGKYFRVAAIDENGHAVLECVDAPSGGVSDVRVNGTTVVADGVADIPIGTGTKYGIHTTSSNYGINANASGTLYPYTAPDVTIKAGTHAYQPIVPRNQHTASFYGLAKAAGDTTMATSSNAVGTYTPEAQTAIQQMLGIIPLSEEGY